MSEHPIQGLMKTAMENLKEMVDVNTIVGDPVETPDGSVILPISKVGFGFAAGGSEFVLKNHHLSSPGQRHAEHEEGKHPFGGGSGGGVSITPIAFLVVNGHGVKMLHLDHTAHLYEKLMEFTPQVVEKIQQMMQSAGIRNQTQAQKAPPTTPPNMEKPFEF
ncbi:GerW family sporulation protein [Bacillus sp. A301a_S52]|nr:GerW family sporulation protein [Bacillus sp. A301a_S52]